MRFVLVVYQNKTMAFIIKSAQTTGMFLFALNASAFANTEFRKLIDLNNNFNANEIKVVKYARENIPDLTANNIELINNGYYTRIWATALLEISSSDIKYEKFVQDTKKYTVETALENKEKKYIVQVVSKEQTQLDEYNKTLKEIKQMEEIEILYENENGFVAKINR